MNLNSIVAVTLIKNIQSMKKSQLYTRTGDLGTTSLVGGQRVSKATDRLESYGTVDELNAWIGVLASDPALPATERPTLLYISHKLFDLGAYLATATPPDGTMPQATSLGQEAISRIEHRIDELDAATPPANRFVLPGGSQLSAFAHVARTVCRRAERRIIALAATPDAYVDPAAVRFVNRLSDYLFILSRYINHSNGITEVYWDKEI